jgi:hypothetical protein
MKKYLSALIVLGVLFVHPAKAASTVYGFMNGNFYDINGIPKYACLPDGNCYDIAADKMTTLSEILGLSSSVPQTVVISDGLPTPPPVQIVYVPVPTPVPQPTPTPTPTPTPDPVPTPQPAPVLKSAYTEQELLSKICDTSWKNLEYAGSRQPYPCDIVSPSRLAELYWPVTTEITSDSVRFTINANFKVNFNNQVFDGNQKCGLIQTFPNEFSPDYNCNKVSNLIPDTQYSYQLIYSEPGRDDTVIIKSFRTLP